MGEAGSSIELTSLTRSTFIQMEAEEEMEVEEELEVEEEMEAEDQELVFEEPIPPMPDTDTEQWHDCLQNAEIRRMLGFFGAILMVFLSLNIFLAIITTQDVHECQISFTVSKDGEANFRTVSAAIDACPNYHQFKVCVFIREGRYLERVEIGAEKTNLILIGAGLEETIIASNASSDTVWPEPTLWVVGKGFMAQNLSIINTAKYGIAVDNWAMNTAFFQCKFVGQNMTLHMKKHTQFYRDCDFHGGSHLVSGDGSAFFQRCQFSSLNLYNEKVIVFSGHSNLLSHMKFGFIFDMCEFRILGGRPTAQKVLLGSALGNGASIIVMQSYLDELLTGYFEEFGWNDTYFAIFGNHGLGANITNLPPSVHVLESRREASRYSLRSFFAEAKWTPPAWVKYDLDLINF